MASERPETDNKCKRVSVIKKFILQRVQGVVLRCFSKGYAFFPAIFPHSLAAPAGALRVTERNKSLLNPLSYKMSLPNSLSMGGEVAEK